MKKIMPVMLAVMISSYTFAQKIQEKEVPGPVKSMFQKTYPEAKNIKWENEGDKIEAGFELNNAEQSVLFDSQGNILETEIEIEINQLPQGVLEFIKSNYKGQNVKEASKITNAKGGVLFEAEIKGLELFFDSQGKLIKESKE